MKKEEITVKLTISNLQKVLKILNEYKQEYCTYYTTYSLQPIISKFEKLYLFYSTDSKEWYISTTKSQGRTLIKPKQLKELLDGEPPYTSKYWDNPLWEGTKGGIGDKGLEYKPKTLEVGKWYKYQGFDHKGNDTQIMFLFNGIKGNEGKMIGFDNNGEYCDNISIYDTSVETFQEASHQEVIQSFVYHMETFANKSKRKKTFRSDEERR